MAQNNVRRNVVPDALDLRDRQYQPSIWKAPPATLPPRFSLPVLNQGETNACTGFGLATVVNALLNRRSQGDSEPATSPVEPDQVPVSPFMLYSMARRYDEFPGANEDAGSSVRGAMKGWYHHGVCASSLWSTIGMPNASNDPQQDWWLDAALRPLGAYYRVDPRSVTDMHIALCEVGVLYASAICHSGWMTGFDRAGNGKLWSIPAEPTLPSDGGHAFAIVGYNEEGLIVQNSWGSQWGSGGHAVLTYEDWIANAMDCWVAQLGVVTHQHKAVAAAATLRVREGHVVLASDRVLRDREISPFIIDMENDGKLSSSGLFRTNEGDIHDLVNFHMDQARERWGLSITDPMDMAIYAHGGLTGEREAADRAADWIHALYDAHIFPIWLMWESDLPHTLEYMLAEWLRRKVPTGVGVGGFRDWWSQRLERLLSKPGSAVWDEMKENAAAVSGSENCGGRLLYKHASQTEWFKQKAVRLHLVGHSAGSVLQCHLASQMIESGWPIESITFLAAAATMDLFNKKLLTHVQASRVKRLNLFHLRDSVELQDDTCKPLLGYNHSLLYLVSRSFEHGAITPLLGLEKDYEALIRPMNLPNVHAWSTPGNGSDAAQHGAFDNDCLTMQTTISLMKTVGLSSLVDVG